MLPRTALPGNRRELLAQVRRPQGDVLDLRQSSQGRFIRGRHQTSQADVAQDAGEQIVEVMRQHLRHDTQAFQFLNLPAEMLLALFIGALALADIRDDAMQQQTALVRSGDDVFAHPQTRTVRPAETVF